MRKTTIYIGILLVLLVSVYFILIRPSGSPYSNKEAGFTISDTANIGKFFIVAQDGTSVLVRRTPTGWTVNEKYKALPSMVRLILNTFYQQQALYPVTKAAVKNAISQLSTMGTKIEVYDRNEKVICKFYVGGEAPNGTGSVMMMEGASKPYIVHIVNFNGVLNSRFSCLLSDWKDRTVFNVNPQLIKSVTVSYNDHPEHSFIIRNENNSVSVSPENSKIPMKGVLNDHNARVYLSYFTNVNCEGFLNGSTGMDSILKNGARHSTIDVEATDGGHQRADLYWIALNRRSKNATNHAEGIPDDYDSDRLYAVINNNADTVMIQQFIFRKIFRKYADFNVKETKPVE